MPPTWCLRLTQLPPAGPAGRRSQDGARFTKGKAGIPTYCRRTGLRSRPNKQPELRHANGCEEKRMHAAPLLRKPCRIWLR
jgi:hypothetical protein